MVESGGEAEESAKCTCFDGGYIFLEGEEGEAWVGPSCV